MNIMKTNMLLFDNKIKNENDDKNSGVVKAPIPESNPQQGMKALAFMGMKNLLSDPELAQEVGVKNSKDYPADDKDSAKSYVAPFSSNISFKKNVKQAVILGTAALTLTTSCTKDWFHVEGDKTIQIAKMDVSSLHAALLQLADIYRQTLDEIKAQNQLNQFAWQQALAKLDKIEEYANKTANNTEEAKNAANDFYEEMYGWLLTDAVFKQVVTSALDRANTQLELNGRKYDDANEFLAAILNSIGSGENGTLTLQQAMQLIMGYLKNIDKNVSHIAKTVDKIKEYTKNIKDYAKDIKNNTGDIKDNTAKMVEQGDSLIAYNKTLIASNRELKSAIETNTQTMRDGINTLDQDIKDGVKALGFTQFMTAGAIIAAINHNTAVTEQANTELKRLREDYNNHIITEQEYADKVLEALNDIKNAVKQGFADFNKYAKNDSIAQAKLLEEATKTRVNTDSLRESAKDVIKNQEAEYAMLVIVNDNIKQVDTDLINSEADLKKYLGIEFAQLKQTMLYLGYTQAQIAAMSIHQVVMAIKENTSAVKENGEAINALGIKLDDMIQKGELTAAEVKELLQGIKDSIDELNAQFADFVASYKKDMAELIKIGKNVERIGYITIAQNAAMQKTVNNMARDLRSGLTILKQVRNDIKNGDLVDFSEITDILKEIKADANAGKDQILEKLDTQIANQETIIEKIEKQKEDVNYIKIFLENRTDDNKDVIDAIATWGDKIEVAINNASTANINALDDVGSKIDSLKALVQQFMGKFDVAVGDWHTHNNAMDKKLNEMQKNLANIEHRTYTIISQGNTAEGQRKQIDDDIKALQDALGNLNIIGGGSITVEQMDSLMAAYDHYNVYKPLLESIKNKPGYDFSNMEKLLGDIYTGNNTYQANAILWAQEIARMVQGLDMTSENYTQDLNDIKDLLRGQSTLLVELNGKEYVVICDCKCDNDTNEGILNAIKNKTGNTSNARRTSAYTTVDEWVGAQKEAERDYAIRQAVNDAILARPFMTTARQIAEENAKDVATVDAQENLQKDDLKLVKA